MVASTSAFPKLNATLAKTAVAGVKSVLDLTLNEVAYTTPELTDFISGFLRPETQAKVAADLAQWFFDQRNTKFMTDAGQTVLSGNLSLIHTADFRRLLPKTADPFDTYYSILLDRLMRHSPLLSLEAERASTPVGKLDADAGRLLEGLLNKVINSILGPLNLLHYPTLMAKHVSLLGFPATTTVTVDAPTFPNQSRFRLKLSLSGADPGTPQSVKVNLGKPVRGEPDFIFPPLPFVIISTPDAGAATAVSCHAYFQSPDRIVIEFRGDRFTNNKNYYLSCLLIG